MKSAAQSALIPRCLPSPLFITTNDPGPVVGELGPLAGNGKAYRGVAQRPHIEFHLTARTVAERMHAFPSICLHRTLRWAKRTLLLRMSVYREFPLK
jgi:hypothetical protein